jgi:hypothetical protein
MNPPFVSRMLLCSVVVAAWTVADRSLAAAPVPAAKARSEASDKPAPAQAASALGKPSAAAAKPAAAPAKATGKEAPKGAAKEGPAPAAAPAPAKPAPAKDKASSGTAGKATTKPVPARDAKAPQPAKAADPGETSGDQPATGADPAQPPMPDKRAQGQAGGPAATVPEAPGNPAADPMETSADEEAAREDEEAAAESPKIARPVNGDPVQVFGWREWAVLGGVPDKLLAKLDTGALTSAIHAEEQELFERDGKKWVRFVVTDPRREGAKRVRISAPLVRTTRVKSPGGESETRKVVRLDLQIGERKLRAEFSLTDRNNMICPVLVGRGAIKELGMVDPGRTFMAEQKVFR